MVCSARRTLTLQYLEVINTNGDGVAINIHHIVSFSINEKILVIKTVNKNTHEVAEVSTIPDACSNQILNYFKQHIQQ